MEQTDRYAIYGNPLWIVADWIENHCVVPDGDLLGEPFVMYDWQLFCTMNHYDVKANAPTRDDNGNLIRSAAFVNRRSLIVAPQKSGKGPWSATIIAAEAVGPVLFAGWATGGEIYACEDNGCMCGWEYEYRAGEPMGRRWPTPLVQLMATSEDQANNVYRPLQSMIRNSVLGESMKVREGFIKLPGNGRIDLVTTAASSRLGQQVTFALMDESGLYTTTNKLTATADTISRGAAGMSGRTMQTTNCWNPAEASVAQRVYESNVSDVFKFYEKPPPNLSWRNKEERRKILKWNYRGSPHIDINAIEAEVSELMERDPAQAERFFGNRIVAGAGAWLKEGLWGRTQTTIDYDVDEVCAGFDGAETDDWTGIRLETKDGFQFTPTYGPDERPAIWNPAEYGGRIPRNEVSVAWDEINRRYRIVRAYLDPFRWQSEIENWALEYGEDIFVEWATHRVTPMHLSLERFVTDLESGTLTHDSCPHTALHVANARKIPKLQDRYILGKPSQTQKIDLAMASVLAHEAASDARADGWADKVDTRVFVFR